MVKIKKGRDVVLDVGCGNGSKVEKIRGMGIECYGIDIDKTKFEKSEYLIYADAAAIPFGAKKFTKVICTEVLEHVNNDKQVLSEIARVLKKGGLLYLTTPRSIRWFNWWDPAWLKWKLIDKNYNHRHYSVNELIRKLNDCGFEIRRCQVLFGLSWLLTRWVNVVLKYVLFKVVCEPNTSCVNTKPIFVKGFFRNLYIELMAIK